MGTGRLSQNEEDGMGLAGEHDYAIIDMKEFGDQQYFLIKNPWSEGTSWKGHVFFKRPVIEVQERISGLDIADKPSSHEEYHLPLSPGTFWMGLNDVFQTFESIYLNWNPRLFSHKKLIHFTWDLSTFSSSEGAYESNPQYVVCSKEGGTVWLLLGRHFATCAKKSASTVLESESGFVSLCAFEKCSERVTLSDGASSRSPFVDSPNSLLKLELSAARPCTVVVCEQDLPRSRNGFTLSAYSLASLSIFEAQEKFTHSISRHGAWTTTTAGGNASSPLYYTNPQFSLCLSDASDLELILQSPTEGLPIHLKLIWANGSHVHTLRSKDVVGDSSEYRKGFAVARISNVEAGVYTIICSTFERGQLGRFVLRVKSMSICALEKVSTVFAGRFVTKAPLASFRLGSCRLHAPLRSQRLTRVSMVARCFSDSLASNRSTLTPMRLSFVYGQGSMQRTLECSGEGEYQDGGAGLQCPQVDIQPPMCEDRGVWVVVERLALPGLRSNEFVDVELTSDAPIEVEHWMSDGG